MITSMKSMIHNFFCFGCRKKLKKSVFFDETFYKGNLPWMSFGALFPRFHYMVVGRHRGIPCSRVVDTHYCATKYGIPESEVFLKYCSYGVQHGWFTREPEEVCLCMETQQALVQSRNVVRTTKNAICLHLYHYELWDEFKALIEMVDDLTDLYLTLTDHGDRTVGMKQQILASFPNAQILVFPNHGRDIFPFQTLVQAGVFNGYKAICKLHTKSSLASENWRQRLVDAVIKDRQRFLEILELIEREGAGIVGASTDMYGGTDCWNANVEWSQHLIPQLGVDQELLDRKPDFLGGSIFVISGEVLEKFSHLKLKAEDWPGEAGQLDGTVGHAIERMYSVVATQLGLKVVGISE